MNETLEYLLDQANQAEMRKDWALAEKTYQKVFLQFPQNPEAAYSLAFLYMRNRLIEPAWKYIQMAQDAYQNHHLFWFQYAQIAFKLNHFEQAIEACQKAIDLEPQAQYWLLLAQAQIKTQELTSALKSLKEVLISQADHQLAHHYLGALYLKQNENMAAIYHLKKAVEIDPTDIDSLSNLGFAYLDHNQETEAESIFLQILDSHPDFEAAIEGLSQIYVKQNKKELAIKMLKQALANSPKNIVLNYILQTLEKIEPPTALSLAYLKYKLKEDPSDLKCLHILSNLYESQGEFEKSQLQLRQLQAALPENEILKLRYDLMLPLMGDSGQIQDHWHHTLEQILEQKQIKGLTFEEADLNYFSTLSFYTYTYQTRGDGRRFREKYVNLFDAHFQQWEAEPNKEQAHIGFLVSKGHENIFIKSMKGLLNRLNLNEFKVTIFAPEIGYEQIIKSQIQQDKIQYCSIEQSIPEIVKTVRRAKCDILNFWEIGTDNQNFFLPFYRLAPVQTLGWGWPMTSGNPKVDYYFSSQNFEIATADDFYTEKLLRFRGLNSYYFRPQMHKKHICRRDLGLPENKRLYFCSQTVLKIHPDFDQSILQILENDPDARIYFLLSKFTGADQFFEQRIKKHCKQHGERLFFLKRRPFEEYLQLISVMDLMLDPFHYVGANTSLDAFSLGVPVITLPTHYQRGRFTYAAYQEMQIQDAIARSPEHYVNLVEHFGKNRDARQYLSQKILNRCDVLFENSAVVEDYQHFFEQTLHQIRS